MYMPCKNTGIGIIKVEKERGYVHVHVCSIISIAFSIIKEGRQVNQNFFEKEYRDGQHAHA